MPKLKFQNQSERVKLKLIKNYNLNFLLFLEASKRIRKTNREHDLIKRRKLEEEVFEKLTISKALANIIIALGE